MYRAINFDLDVRDQWLVRNELGAEVWYVIEPGDMTRYTVSISRLSSKTAEALFWGPNDLLYRVTVYPESAAPKTQIIEVHHTDAGTCAFVDAHNVHRDAWSPHHRRVALALLNHHLGVHPDDNLWAHEFQP